MYSILDDENTTLNEKSTTNKGDSAFIEFQDFYDTLFQKKIFWHQMNVIKSKNHNLGTCKTNKISLSYFGDKRYIVNVIETFVYGLKSI